MCVGSLEDLDVLARGTQCASSGGSRAPFLDPEELDPDDDEDILDPIDEYDLITGSDDYGDEAS